MARVLILTLVFPPDGVSTAVIMGDLAVDLLAAGHDVRVVTTVPHYNRDVVAEERQPLTKSFWPFLYRSDFHGVPVLHVAMPRKGPRVLPRLLAWIQFHIVSSIVALACVEDVDVIIAPSPPLTIGVCAWLLGKCYGAPFIYIVQEIYPDIAITLGVIKSRWIIEPLLKLESFVYSRARLITVIAARMRQRLIDKAVDPSKVRVVPNFVDVDDMSPLPKSNPFSLEHGLDGTFIVSYAGNMGPAQGLETVIHAADILRDQQGLKFLLVGEGGFRDEIEELIRSRKLDNVLMLPHQPYALVPQIYAASDVCLVLLAAHAGADAVPSKVYRVMACARPILACADDDSDLAALVREAGCGTVVTPGSARTLADAVLRAMQEPSRLERQGAAGRSHVIDHYSRAKISEQYEAIVREVVRNASPTLRAKG